MTIIWLDHVNTTHDHLRIHPDPGDPLRSLTKSTPDGAPDVRTLEHFKTIKNNSTTSVPKQLLILQLYQCYKLDFDLFGYNLEGLLWSAASEEIFPDVANITLIMNKRFMLDEMTQRNTSKFAMFYVQPVLGGKVKLHKFEKNIFPFGKRQEPKPQLRA